MKSTWREYAKPIIREVLQETKGNTETEIKKALRKAYPFGQRSLHPYKIWLDEIKIQRGLKHSKTKHEINPNQTELF